MLVRAFGSDLEGSLCFLSEGEDEDDDGDDVISSYRVSGAAFSVLSQGGSWDHPWGGSSSLAYQPRLESELLRVDRAGFDTCSCPGLHIGEMRTVMPIAEGGGEAPQCSGVL